MNSGSQLGSQCCSALLWTGLLGIRWAPQLKETESECAVALVPSFKVQSYKGVFIPSVLLIDH